MFIPLCCYFFINWAHVTVFSNMIATTLRAQIFENVRVLHNFTSIYKFTHTCISVYCIGIFSSDIEQKIMHMLLSLFAPLI